MLPPIDHPQYVHPVETKAKSRNVPPNLAIEKARNLVLPYFKARFPLDQQLNPNAISLDTFKVAQVSSRPFDTLTGAMPSYQKGFCLTLKFRDHPVEVYVTTEGERCYSSQLHYDQTNQISQNLMHLLLRHIKNTVAINQPCDLEILRSTRTQFDKDLMLEANRTRFAEARRGIADNNTAIDGYHCYIKLNGIPYFVSIAEDPNEMRIRMEQDKPTNLQIRMKHKEDEKTQAEQRKAQENDADDDEVAEIRDSYIQHKHKRGKVDPEIMVESEPEMDDRGNMSKPMSHAIYTKKIAELKTDPSVRAKVIIIPKNGTLPPLVISKAKQMMFDLLMQKYPFTEIKAESLEITETKWVPDLSYGDFYSQDNDSSSRFGDDKFSEGYVIHFQYQNERYAIHSTKNGDKIACNSIKNLRSLPKVVCNALAHEAERNSKFSFGVMQQLQFKRENIDILEIKEVEWRQENPGMPSPLRIGYAITYTSKGSNGLKHYTTIDQDGNIR